MKTKLITMNFTLKKTISRDHYSCNCPKSNSKFKKLCWI